MWKQNRSDLKIVNVGYVLIEEVKFDYLNKWYMHNPESILVFWDTNRSPNLGNITRPSDSQQQKKRACQIVDFTIPANHRIKLKESKKEVRI